MTTTTEHHGIGHEVKNRTLDEVGLNWDVQRRPLFIGEEVYAWDSEGAAPSARPTDKTLSTHVANVREDTGEVLGVVGSNYQILQNSELMELVTAVESETGAEIESAMSLHHGKDVFFLMKNSSFELPGQDRMDTYHFFGNNHAGERCINILPTSIRPVCTNTLNMMLYKSKEISLKIKHTTSMKDRIADAIMVLKHSEQLAKTFKEQCEWLTQMRCSEERLDDYFDDVYTASYGTLPEIRPLSQEDEYTKGEQSKITRHDAMLEQWRINFQVEAEEYGANHWIALNAVTKWVDHERTVRGSTSDPSMRIHTNLLGSAATMKETAFRLAMETV